MLVRSIVVTFLILLTSHIPLSAEQNIGIVVYPRYAFEPATFRLTLRVEPDKDNREACLTYDGPQFSSSCWQVDGEHHPKLKQIYLKDLPGGMYQVEFKLRKLREGWIRVTTGVCVISRSGGVEDCLEASV